MTNDELQALAEELSAKRGSDVKSDTERVRTIELAIANHELGCLQNSGGKAFFPLLKKHSTKVPYEEFLGILIDVLMDLLKNYNPGKGATFATALSNLLRWRIADYWKQYKKDEKKFVPLSIGEKDGEEEAPDIVIPDMAYSPEEMFFSPFRLFMFVAPLVALRKAQEKHLPKSKKSYFEGFFTFDTTAQTKNRTFDAGDVIAENDTLFPLMENLVLAYLLDGQFASMRDVVENPVRDPLRLERRNETMQVCYGLSKPTVVTKNKRYRQLFDAIGV